MANIKDNNFQFLNNEEILKELFKNDANTKIILDLYYLKEKELNIKKIQTEIKELEEEKKRNQANTEIDSKDISKINNHLNDKEDISAYQNNLDKIKNEIQKEESKNRKNELYREKLIAEKALERYNLEISLRNQKIREYQKNKINEKIKIEKIKLKNDLEKEEKNIKKGEKDLSVKIFSLEDTFKTNAFLSIYNSSVEGIKDLYNSNFKSESNLEKEIIQQEISEKKKGLLKMQEIIDRKEPRNIDLNNALISVIANYYKKDFKEFLYKKVKDYNQEEISLINNLKKFYNNADNNLQAEEQKKENEKVIKEIDNLFNNYSLKYNLIEGTEDERKNKVKNFFELLNKPNNRKEFLRIFSKVSFEKFQTLFLEFSSLKKIVLKKIFKNENIIDKISKLSDSQFQTLFLDINSNSKGIILISLFKNKNIINKIFKLSEFQFQIFFLEIDSFNKETFFLYFIHNVNIIDKICKLSEFKFQTLFSELDDDKADALENLFQNENLLDKVLKLSNSKFEILFSEFCSYKRSFLKDLLQNENLFDKVLKLSDFKFKTLFSKFDYYTISFFKDLFKNENLLDKVSKLSNFKFKTLFLEVNIFKRALLMHLFQNKNIIDKFSKLSDEIFQELFSEVNSYYKYVGEKEYLEKVSELAIEIVKKCNSIESLKENIDISLAKSSVSSNITLDIIASAELENPVDHNII